MYGCVEFQSPMTGSTRAGPLQPPEDSAPLPAGQAQSSSSSSSSSRSSCGERDPTDTDEISGESPRRRQDRARKKMSPVRPISGQPIQLTPLWEHVVRTQRFPTEVDTRETFDEISERLRDPEWEVRQHALRVLVDVLPTLGGDVVDEAMLPVLPELVNNLGHLAPAVRKGALDTLRVYLVCSRKREEIVRGILTEDLNRSDCLDAFQTNVSLGVILSTPSLLFPSSSSPRPSKQMLREAIGALATRLVQMQHQEATIRTLVKIHEVIGNEEFESYLRELDSNAKRDYEVLCDIYKVSAIDNNNSRKKSGNKTTKRKKIITNGVQKTNEEKGEERQNELNVNCQCVGVDTPGSDENVGKGSIDKIMPTARIVLETEIKFNEETAITMTILEEKNDDSDEDDESDVESGEEFVNDEDDAVLEEKNSLDDRQDEEVKDEWIERRKTPRRVHFGGEIVKLRTPDSDESEILQNAVPHTRIPIPILPTTKMPAIRTTRSMSNPCSPNVARSRTRKSRSASNSPKREFYTHDASLSPKKSILLRSGLQASIVRSIHNGQSESSKRSEKMVEEKIDKFFGKSTENDRGWAFEIFDNDEPVNLGTKEVKSDEPKSSTTRSTVDDRQVSGKDETSTMANNASTDTERKISIVEVNENVKVERIELVKGADVADNSLVESSLATVEDKHENGGEDSGGAINSSGMKTEEAGEHTGAREVGEKFESLREVKAKPLSETQSRSPVRSPKKPVFESPFPRKERNYILMELSSPVKTGTRKINDNVQVGSNDGQRQLGVPINGSALPRGYSPMGSPVDRSFDSTLSSGVDDKVEEKNSKVLDVSRSNKFVDKREPEAEGLEEIEGVEKDDRTAGGASPIPNTIGESACNKFRESNWEELGLVDEEVLNDLHNKDDWRARVRGLERVASALRTTSALIAIESRLGSLLQAVLGGERSCRVAAAGMSVARVVVAGVSEEALRRRLPQVAWGLARQGGPNAAQLARVAMLRLRPALLLEQLLQPHCIKARNAKTRENALQLLIFSLVTFPSTEFKVDNVAGKVAAMVFDRRRRVRQAALDTLAVLAQIYEPEEVMKAGKLAAKGQQDGEAMVAAIRARLARKSLPMVSADGLVVYGLQISPTVQTATGPDVDWIVAGSGSVSPGTGRTRGQIIATTTRRGVQEKNAKNESTKNCSNLKGPNFVALGVGLHSKNEQQQPFAWQLVTHSSQDGSHRILDKLWEPKNRDSKHGESKNHDVKSRLTGSLRHYRSATDRLDDSFESETTPIFLFNDKDVIMKQRKTEENFHRRMDEIYAERTGIGSAAQDITGNRLESRIPVPQSRDREANGKETRIGTSYGRRRIQEGNNLKNWSVESRTSDGSRQRSIQRAIDQSQPEINNSQRHQRASRDMSPQRFSPTRDTYRSIYRQRRGFPDGSSVYREVQTAPTTTTTTTTTTSHELSRRRRTLKDSLGTRDSRGTSTEDQTTRDSRTNRRHATADGYGVLNPSDHNRDKTAVEEEDCNDANQCNLSAQTKPYRIQSPNDRSSQCPALLDNGPSETSSNSSSNTSGDDVRLEVLQNSPGGQCIEESFASDNDENLRPSPTRSPITEKSFNVITHESNPSRRNSIEYGISTDNAESNTLVYSSTDPDNEAEDTDKGSSMDDASTIPIAQSSNGKFLESLENENGDSSSEVEDMGDHRSARNVSASFVANESDSSSGGISKVWDDSPASNESEEIVVGTSNAATSPARIDSIYALSSIEAVGFDNSGTSIDENDGPDVTMAFVREYPTDVSSEDPSRGRGTSPRVDEDKSAAGALLQSEEQRQKFEEAEEEIGSVKNTVSTLVASRPHSRDPSLHEDASIQPLDFRTSREVVENSAANIIASTIARPPSGRASESPEMSSSTAISPNVIAPNVRRDSATRGKINRAINTGNETAITVVGVNGAQSGGTSEKSEAPRRVATSRVPRIRQKNRTNVSRVAPMPGGQSTDKNTTKAKSTTQQCLTQLESNDWESVVKGLKALSEIARQQPEQLDSFGPGTLGRLLGRHVRNLRSQVSRAACLAAGDVFGSQARCIDQELDDIAGPLLHRTADTNKFLRADSNEALDRMVEHLTPNKTILVVVHRGASHQNAIVRAATARLLASIVDRLGPDAVMSLPRDVREKLIASGAKLLMDGNLDARNYAKRMFRRLARCEGFRKALKDSVPEATLRHIDKTLKSL